jgi:hypothetical protein
MYGSPVDELLVVEDEALTRAGRSVPVADFGLDAEDGAVAADGLGDGRYMHGHLAPSQVALSSFNLGIIYDCRSWCSIPACSSTLLRYNLAKLTM